MTFRKGEKVVCIDDRFAGDVYDYFNALPRVLKLYTIRDIVTGQDGQGNSLEAVRLVEKVNLPDPETRIEPGFAAWRFVNRKMWKQWNRDFQEGGRNDDYNDPEITGDEWRVG